MSIAHSGEPVSDHQDGASLHDSLQRLRNNLNFQMRPELFEELLVTFSFSASREEVASSRTKIFGLRIAALAIASLWR